MILKERSPATRSKFIIYGRYCVSIISVFSLLQQQFQWIRALILILPADGNELEVNKSNIINILVNDLRSGFD